MFYTIYKVTNILSGKIYIGMHQTDDLDDGYLGSGKAIKRAIAKYGPDAFSKDFIAVYDNREAMLDHERLLVNEEFVARSDTYNIKLGGEGGWDHIKTNPMLDRNHTEATKKLKSLIAKQHWTNLSEDEKEAHRQRARENASKNPSRSFLGKHHSDETKRKLAELGSQKIGKRNPMYGKRWIHNRETGEARVINEEELSSFTSQGWDLGRAVKRPREVKNKHRRAKARQKPTPSGRKRQIKEDRVRIVKVTDEDYIAALKSSPSIAQALIKLGLAPKGKNYTRAKRLLGIEGKLTTKRNNLKPSE